MFLHLFWDHKLGCHISEGSVTFWENYWPKSQRGPTLTSSSAIGLYMTWSNPCRLHSGAQISLHQLNVMVTFKLKGRSFQLWSSIRFIFLPCHLSPNKSQMGNKLCNGISFMHLGTRDAKYEGQSWCRTQVFGGSLVQWLSHGLPSHTGVESWLLPLVNSMLWGSLFNHSGPQYSPLWRGDHSIYHVIVGRKNGGRMKRV